MKNSKIYYLYRDASNYKYFNEIIIYGALRLEDLKPFFHDHQFFVPSEVGLLDLQPEIFTIDDHIWHELYSIEPTNVKPSIDMTANEFIKLFESLHAQEWNEFEVFKRKGLL